MFILAAPAGQALPLPKGEFDVPLMVVDRSFDENNQIAYPEPIPAVTGLAPGTGKPPSDEVTGDVILVNGRPQPDRKSTRLNSSHANISYAVFCLKKKEVDR